MVLVMKDNMLWGKNMERENIYGVMGVFMMEIGIIIKLVVKGFTSGVMVGDMKENG